MNLVDFIPYGHDNAITSNQLGALTGLCSRDIRKIISQAKRDTLIVNLQDGKGYFKPTKDERELVERYLKQEESRFKTIAWTLRSAREFLKE